jgi:hypothetical protein
VDSITHTPVGICKICPTLDIPASHAKILPIRNRLILLQHTLVRPINVASILINMPINEATYYGVIEYVKRTVREYPGTKKVQTCTKKMEGVHGKESVVYPVRLLPPGCGAEGPP